MKLACISDNGDTLDVAVALQEQPYAVRALLADALFQCQEHLYDTLDLLHAERAVRGALLSFQGNQEKYARAYVLTRTLDPRTQQTPRAHLLYSSFNHGGPIALAGIFYATFDAHRNLRSREILDFLLNRASEQSIVQLAKRSGSFPCNPSTRNWLLRILEKLEPDQQELACIIRCLGVTVPQNVFTRARVPSTTWGAEGEPIRVEQMMLHSVANEEEFAKALDRLQYIGFLRLTDTTIYMDHCIGVLLRDRFEHVTFICEATKIIAHAFPKHRHLEPGWVTME